MEKNELRNMNDKELSDRCEELRATNYQLKAQAAHEKKDQVARDVRQNKKEIARILTILRERELKEKN